MIRLRPDHRRTTPSAPSFRTVSLLACAALGLAACDDDDDDATTGNTNPPAATNPAGGPLTTYYSSRDAMGVPRVTRADQGYEGGVALEPGQDRGLTLDYHGNLYQVGASANGPGVRMLGRARTRPAMSAFDPFVDRELSGPNTTLADPRGLASSRADGTLFVADRGAGSITVLGQGAMGDAPPIARTEMTLAPTAVAYDEPNDRLYVGHDGGRISVYDDYKFQDYHSAITPAVPSRSWTIRDPLTQSPAGSISDLKYDSANDRLVVADQGTPLNTKDGAVHVIEGASTAVGDVEPRMSLCGPSTGLGDPSSISIDGRRLRVADAGSGRMLLFDRYAEGTGAVDRAPDIDVEASGASGVAVEPFEPEYGRGPSDIDDPNTPMDGFAYIGTPAGGGPGANTITRYDTTSGDASPFDASPGAGQVACSVAYDAVGDAYVGYEDPVAGTGGVLIASRVAKGRNRAGVDDAVSDSYDRRIAGFQTGLVSPRGIDIDDASGRIFVADSGSQSIRVFDQSAGGDVPPRFFSSLQSAPWDLDYDRTNDRLYVTQDDGRVAVFDRYLETEPSFPDRYVGFDDGLTPGVQESQNLRGIAYDETNDRLVATDVGDPLDPMDGRVYGLEQASLAAGTVSPTVRYTGATHPTLADAHDVAFDGASMYVADQAGGAVHRHDDVFGATGVTPTPSASFAAPAAASVVLSPSGLSPTTGGSYR